MLLKEKRNTFISENKLRNEDKKTIREFKGKHFSHRTVLLEFSTKTKEKLLLFSQSMTIFSHGKSFQEGKFERAIFSLATHHQHV